MSGAGKGPASVLITGAGGYIGALTTAALAPFLDSDEYALSTLLAADVRETPPERRLPGVEYLTLDIRDPGIGEVLARKKVRAVVHLASIVTPGKKSNRELERAVDVGGTENILRGCLAAGVERIILTSSGAAYGYYPDNPEWLDEEDQIRGNPEFAYSDHKRLVEEMLKSYRREHPELNQLIMRPGTILGRTTRNQITDLFDAKRIIGLKGAATPFVFIWDKDVVGVIVKGLLEEKSGIFNLAGDGFLTMKEIARLLGKTFLPLPVSLVRLGLAVGKKLGLSQYGPEQVDFIRYRPVLANRRLKEEFGYTPAKTSREVFEYFMEGRRLGRQA